MYTIPSSKSSMVVEATKGNINCAYEILTVSKYLTLTSLKILIQINRYGKHMLT